MAISHVRIKINIHYHHHIFMCVCIVNSIYEIYHVFRSHHMQSTVLLFLFIYILYPKRCVILLNLYH